jgi:hypothetical protein
MEIKNVTRTARKVLDLGMIDVVDSDGVLREDVPCKGVMVTAESDLANLPDYQPGTIAFVAGFASMWQKSAAGTWVEL